MDGSSLDLTFANPRAEKADPSKSKVCGGDDALPNAGANGVPAIPNGAKAHFFLSECLPTC